MVDIQLTEAMWNVDLCRERSAFRCNSWRLMSTDGEEKH